MSYDSVNQKVVLFGGFNYSSCCFGDTWTWNGTNWHLEQPLSSPSARYYHAMAFYQGTSQMVLFGGVTKTFTSSNETWVWDGANWTQQAPTTTPPARNRTALVYDTTRRVIFMFGGAGAGVKQDSWIWGSDNDWHQVFPSTVPPPRYHHAMAFDPVRGYGVLFGGYKDNNGIDMLNDTWIWDGSNWSQVFPAHSPSARIGHGMAYSSVSGGILLFGGESQLPAGGGAATDKNDTWLWNGSDWVQLSTSPSPVQRGDLRLAFDTSRNEVVMFGVMPLLYPSDTWIWALRRGSAQTTSQ